jgi:hypothetical protein
LWHATHLDGGRRTWAFTIGLKIKMGRCHDRKCNRADMDARLEGGKSLLSTNGDGGLGKVNGNGTLYCEGVTDCVLLLH